MTIYELMEFVTFGITLFSLGINVGVFLQKQKKN